jgi:hypothetical protein
MYNRLEAALDSTLLNPNDMPLEDLVRNFSANPIIKVSGRSEIEDYQRASLFFEQFNKLGEAIAYAGLISSDEIKQKKSALRQELAATTGKNKREEIQKQMDTLTNSALVAEN